MLFRSVVAERDAALDKLSDARAKLRIITEQYKPGWVQGLEAVARSAGYDPDAMLNCMARLGWGPKVDDKTTALLPRERMLELFFNGGRMRNSPANLDIEKLNSFDRKYKARKKV